MNGRIYERIGVPAANEFKDFGGFVGNMSIVCPIGSREAWQIGPFWRAQKTSTATACPIAVEALAQVEALPKDGTGKTVTILLKLLHTMNKLLLLAFALAGGLSLCPSGSSAAEFASGFSSTGTWNFSSALPGYAADKSSLYSTDPNATAIWNPEIHSVGLATLSLFVVTHEGNDQNAQVEIVHAGKTNFVSVNLETGKPHWLELGKFDFAGTGDEFIRVSHGSPGTLRLSALKVEIIDAKDGSVWQTLLLDDLMPSNPIVMQKSAPANLRAGPPNPGDWQLTFSDDFNGDHLDTNVWQIAQGETRGVLQSARFPENVVVTNGLLRLVTHHEKRGGKEWTTAMITTRVFHQKYGYWEARYRYAPASGLNQAFWMIKPSVKGSNDGFEIDVNEGHYPNEVNTTLHQDGMNSQSQSYRAGYDLSADFHLYAAEWNEQEVIYYFDGKAIYRVPNIRGHLDCPVIFSTAVLLWAGPIKNSLDGTSMDVDWVRVYQRK